MSDELKPGRPGISEMVQKDVGIGDSCDML